ncbi:hypothetical protein CHU98_g12045 [Xylaria longipes]|nr:hypothetical protein CHU98_g12045 [Xylaria longipes]
MEHPRQRLACDRCHALKLRCQRATGGLQCARCLKAGSLCIFSAPARLGRPLGSGSGSGSSRVKQPTTNTPSADFLSDLLPLDGEDYAMNLWFDGSRMPDSHHILGAAYQQMPPVTPASRPSPPEELPSHGPAPSPQHQHQHHHQHQQHLMSSTSSHHATEQPANRCFECSAAMTQIAALESDSEPVQEILSQLSSLTVAIHSHSRRVHGELRVLQLRLKHKHAVVDDRCTQPISPQEIAAANDCFGTHALIRTNQSFRDVIRSMKKTQRDMNEPVLPSPTSIASHEPSPLPTSTANTAQAANTLLPQYPPPLACSNDRADHRRTLSRDHEKNDPYEHLLNDSTKHSHEAPNSCQLALSLLLNCYLEILNIFIMTFNMIETIVNHYPSNVPLSTDIADHSAGPRNMLNTSFSIFTATQVTQRLLEMVKKDMRNVWELYQSQVQAMAQDGDLDLRQKPARVNPAIPMTFRLGWEKEAAIARLVEDINYRLNALIDM